MGWSHNFDPVPLRNRAKDIRTWNGQAGWWLVVRRGVTELDGELFESRGRGEHQNARWLDVDREGMSDTARPNTKEPASASRTASPR
jgi:hypothetical protein